MIRTRTMVHLTSSTFFGGPERQMLGLAEHLPRWRTVFASFSEGGLCRNFLGVADQRGFEAHALRSDTPRLWRATAEVRSLLAGLNTSVLVCHGYKANLIGRVAAGRLGIPVVGVSRGWTGENFKVRRYESLDRRVLRWMNAVVCVSQAQADKVRRAGVPTDKIEVIRNSVVTDRFQQRDPTYRQQMEELFESPPRLIVGAAGRLSPEKGFDVLIRAAAQVVAQRPDVGFVIFGDGPLKAELQAQIDAAGLQRNFKLAGFRQDLDRYFPHFDVLALSSFTEGLPNVILEAFAAEVPVVSTAVGGVPEVVDDGLSGYLVDAGDHDRFATATSALAGDAALRRAMAAHGRRRVDEEFSFAAQAGAYERLFARVRNEPAYDRVAPTMTDDEPVMAETNA